jgi:hypothetical protein
MINAVASNILVDMGLPKNGGEPPRRGLNVYTTTGIVGIAGRAKDGTIVSGTVEQPLFGLSLYDRIMIAQRCDPVFGVVSGRAGRISGLEWTVTKESKDEDRIADYLKSCKAIHSEYAGRRTIAEITTRALLLGKVRAYLPDVLPDLANFDGALLRWHRRIQAQKDDESQQIIDWMNRPNAQDTFEDYTKKRIQDLMVHGAVAGYKERDEQGLLRSVYVLPGGSVVPLRDRFVSAHNAFAQALPGMDPQIYFSDEVCFSTYMPTSGIAYGLIPLEALVNKVAESLLFDQRAAEAADGTRPPEKVVIMGEDSPFGDLTGEEALKVPLTQDDQSRIEVIINEPRKNAIRVLSGYGTPVVMDLSRADTFQYQNERQKDIREAVALVFNMTNMEINSTGSEDTSGRSTSEAQATIEKEKGIYPLVKIEENHWNNEVLPLRFGGGYKFKFKSGLSDKEQLELDTAMVQSQTYSIDEVRVKRGDEPWGGQYGRPLQGQQPDPNAPSGQAGPGGAASLGGLLGSGMSR